MTKSGSKIEVTEQLTQKIANLARLELTTEEVTKFTSQLKDILGYVEQLNGVDTQGIEPLTHPLAEVVGRKTPLREDEVQVWANDSSGKSKVIQSGPEVLYDGFKVPPIL